jgi:hypothetical protein
MCFNVFFDNRIREWLGGGQNPVPARKRESAQPQAETKPMVGDWRWHDITNSSRSQNPLESPAGQGQE